MLPFVVIYIIFMIALAFRKHTNRYNESIKLQNERYSSDFQNNNFSDKKRYDDKKRYNDIPTIKREFAHYVEM